MNSRERIITAARGGKADVIPVAPYIGNYGAAVAGVPISEYNTNSKKMAQAQSDKLSGCLWCPLQRAGCVS